MSEEYKLKPCPFCGGEATIESEGYDNPCCPTTYIFIMCNACGVICERRVLKPKSNVRSMAVASWNKRPEEDRLRDDNARMGIVIGKFVGKGYINI